MPRASFLVCPPKHYGIRYEINPWMDVRRQADRTLAWRQWRALVRTLTDEIGAAIHTCPPRPGLPDMVFTANAGLVLGRRFVPSRFRYRERAGEEPLFRRWFRRRGYEIVDLPADYRFEGAGDAILAGGTLFAGYHFRTDIQAHAFLGEALGIRVLSVELVNPYFYHMDTCFLPIGDGAAAFYPGAFDRYGLRVLARNLNELVPVSPEEAYQFACNSLVVGRAAVVPAGCPRLTRALDKRGLGVHAVGLSEFVKAGGAARCLTLRIA